MVVFRVLGAVEAHLDGAPIDLGHPKQRGVLAVLLVEANRPVPTGRLLDRVWGEDPPTRGRETLYNYVSRLRAAVSAIGDVRLTRRSGGYQLTLDEQTVDLHRFHHLLAQARADDGRRALELFDQALGLWRGEPLADLDTPWAADLRATWERERFAAELDRTDIALRCGRHAELLPGLTARAARHPLDERIAAHLMLALYRNGRQADALEHYQHVRARLVEDLGADPGPQLQRLHEQILQADPELSVPADTGSAPAPRQLPAAPRSFTGRTDELSALTAALDTATADEDVAAVLVSAIGGAGGIGKTWFALAWAHRHLDRFPDGQLFVDLHGFSPTEEPMAPEVAVRGFLDAMGADPGRIPPDLDAQAALYRSLVAGKRMLIVLDNAATADQVTPLLPGSPACTVLITGRGSLASLIDRHGARHLQLDVLDRAEARALLTARLGADRVTAEPDAVDELVNLCGCYPLALSITARAAATRPHVPLAEVAAELRELGLEMLDHDTDPAASLPAVFSWSLRRLTEEHRTVFALLGIAPGTDTTVPAVAALTGLPSARARKALSALEEASLVERRPHGRYAMHDLVRAYAATTAQDLRDDVRETALVRMSDFYLHTAFAADRLLDPTRQLVQPDPPAPGVHPQALPDADAALAWLEAEHATLLATQRVAVALGRHHVVWHLAWALGTFHVRRGLGPDELTTWRIGLEAAVHLSDPAIRSRTHRFLGRACSRQGLHEEAIEHLERALALAVDHHDRDEQAHTHLVLAFAWGQRGDDRRALAHTRSALDLYRILDHPAREATALNQVGWYAACLGDFDTARDHCRAALTLTRHHHDLAGEADTLDSLGLIAHRTGDHRHAVDHYRQALTLYRTLGNAHMAADTLDHLGHPHAVLGQHEQAREAWLEALELYREQGRDEDIERVQRQLDDLASSPPVADR